MRVTEEEAQVELTYYTLEHAQRDPRFIHQHAVDAWAAQKADKHSKPIQVAFALIGLHLYLTEGYSGTEVQMAHVLLAKQGVEWPPFEPPTERGEITVVDVVRAAPGLARDRMIGLWARSVWEAWRPVHVQIAALCRAHL